MVSHYSTKWLSRLDNKLILATEMHDIATQLVLKWARKGSENKIPVTEDFTRLTLDTIALCAMGYRFNSFYQDDMHPFVKAMTNTLSAGNSPSTLWDVFKALKGGTSQNIIDDQKLMQDVAGDLVKSRHENPTEKKDLLNAMINGKDPRTGEGMRDELITANMITFLVAGHETTSGLLSFAFMQLLKNPAAYRAAKDEVDRVVGKGKIKLEHMKELKYLNAVLRETLRLNPTVPAFVRQVRQENKDNPPSVGGYELNRDSRVVALISKSQQDPEVYGEDAKEFKPERMLDEQFAKLPKGAWKPFGTGMRACIGRPFAWQEALLVTALILQIFDLKLDDPSYEPRVKQTLTIKPRDLYMRATLREGMNPTELQQHLINDGRSHAEALASKHRDDPNDEEDLNEMLILYGSNTGTCETLAQRLASDAGRFGYTAHVRNLDSAIDALPKDQPIVIITASYEGQPPDNAAHFCNWLTSPGDHSGFEGLNYAVFGCGHSDWSATFQRIPTLIDDMFEKKQAKRITPRGFADAAKGDIFNDFDQWTDQTFWPAMAKHSGHTPTNKIIDRSPKLEIDISEGDRASRLRQDVHPAIVHDTQCLVAPGEPEKRHMEITLPSGMAYEPGDYLTILPLNPDSNIGRAMKRYRIAWDANIVINAKGPTTLPTSAPMSVFDLLKGYVELSQPATKKACTLSSRRSIANLVVGF